MKLFGLLILLCFIASAENFASGPQPVWTEGDIKYVHDPSIIKDGDTWYLFSTAYGPNRKGQLPIRCSKDLHRWTLCGHVVDQIPRVDYEGKSDDKRIMGS